jgi:uncharacterized OB-fold protein/acyl dehydratase
VTTTTPTSEDEKAAFLARLKAYEGRVYGPPQRGPDPVNQAMIRHWVEAIGDENPVYVDADAAARSVHRGIIAPPVSLQAWVMRGFRPAPSAASDVQDEINSLLNDAGFTSVVATNCEQEYSKELRVGDHLSTTTTVESISEEKATGLGVGHFLTTLVRYTDDQGDLVANMRFRILKFKPGTGRSATKPNADESPAARPQRPRPAVTQDNAFFFEGAMQHKLLIQRCTSCGTLRHPPRPVCAECRSYDWDTVEASGKATVHSYVVNHYPQVPAFDYPLAVGLFDLEEGTRLVANFLGVEPDEIEIGMPMTVEFVEHDADLTLPAFRPAGARGDRSDGGAQDARQRANDTSGAE